MYDASYIMPLCGFSLIGIANIFPPTYQTSSGELPLSSFAYNLYDELEIAEIRAFMIN